MNLKENLKRLGQEFFGLVFPISCIVCGRGEAYLCENCITKLPRLDKQLCIVCTKPSPFGKTHPECVSRNTVDGMICALTYKDRDVKKIIETFKYHFVSDLAPTLSRFIVEALKQQNLDEFFGDFILIPVPLHQRRSNWRGFNQAELLASELAKQLGISLNTQLVVRSKFTKPQTTLDASGRKKNLENAFNLNSAAENRKFLIVDDIITSGSTANEIAKVLKRNRAGEVWITSIAHG